MTQKRDGSKKTTLDCLRDCLNFRANDQTISFLQVMFDRLGESKQLCDVMFSEIRLFLFDFLVVTSNQILLSLLY